MTPQELGFENLTSQILKDYSKRAPDISGQFLRWFLENIFRLDPQDADDAAVDAKQDKGIDGIYVNDITETISMLQVKTKQKEKSTLGDTELKEFFGSLQQFRTAESIQTILDGKANEKLKQVLHRTKFQEKVQAGYLVEGVFCTNNVANKDALDFIKTITGLSLYDAKQISAEYVEAGIYGGIKDFFEFDTSDVDVISYSSNSGVSAKIFLASALQLLHLKGISDGSLFERNVRLSLGNTKVNKSLIESIKDKAEHRNFPLYHNGINILCDEFIEGAKGKLKIKDYVVVNGAQSLTSLNSTKSRISDDLKILVKIIQVKGDNQLSEKITTNSNNQNAIKPRDLRSNHGIQRRLKAEVASIDCDGIVYEIKQGEKNKGKLVLSNEQAGLILLALDIGMPWNCHQKYKVMDELHSDIFGRPDVTGWKIIALYKAFNSIDTALDGIDDHTFANYTLTKYFLAYSVSEIIKDSIVGKAVFSDFKKVFSAGKIDEFVKVFSGIAATTAEDLNAEISDDLSNADFDYKSELKSPKWVRSMSAKLKASYNKDVKRKKAKSIDILLAGMIN